MNRRYQLQWMVLLAAAVILPTVSLLWFMSRVVANERLVIRQKLEVLYQQKLEEVGTQVKHDFDARIDSFSQTDWTRNPYGLLSRVVFEEGFQGVVIWNPDGRRVYPSEEISADIRNPLSEDALTEARQREFVDRDYEAAIQQYEKLSDSTDPRVLAGLVRCLAGLSRYDEAMTVALESNQPFAASVRLLLLTLLDKEEGGDQALRQDRIQRLAKAINRDLFKQGEDVLPSTQNQLIARRLLEHPEAIGDAAMTNRLTRLADAEQLSLAAAEAFPIPAGPPGVIRPRIIDDRFPVPAGPPNIIRPKGIDNRQKYVIRHPSAFGDLMILLSTNGLASALDGFRSEFENTDAKMRILDAHGRLIAGDPGTGQAAIASMPLPEGFPEGHVELYFDGWSYYREAAGRQITVYIWTGVLVILLILLVGAFAVQAVGRQIRLNRMKNDFIATVSHELKTPLASMRLLVDTLLEGRTRDEAHAEEYLRMIARENERLTRMIENFLSFSRMERNKNAFTMATASPEAIVEDAVDSVCTKYRANNCRLETEITDDLPEIMADHDAIVTVLINLLDNACKYTMEDKQIRLSLFLDGGDACFAVSDNGVGMSRRQLRRIFDSFYQVDDSLARTAEGCGLGLSIVQFIVNAHKGRIEVDSQQGKGSTFTVRLPINRKNEGRGGHANGTDC